jgi:glycerol kinase
MTHLNENFFIMATHYGFPYHRLHINLARVQSPYTHSKAVVSIFSSRLFYSLVNHCRPVAVAGSAIKWLRDSMMMIQTAEDVNTLAKQVPNTGGVYFVTAFSGLLAPYWDPGAAGMLIGMIYCL